MARTNQEAVTAFGEILRFANVPGSYNSQNNRMAANDNRLMIYFQGMKVYIPDNFQPDTLLKLLKTVIFQKPPGSLACSNNNPAVHHSLLLQENPPFLLFPHPHIQ